MKKLKAADLNPINLNIPPYLSRIRFLRSNSADIKVQSQTQSMLATIKMRRFIHEAKRNQVNF